MWGKEILDQAKKIKKTDPLYRQSSLLKNMTIISEHFYFGNLYDFRKLMFREDYMEQIMFSGDMAKDVRSPYKEIMVFFDSPDKDKNEAFRINKTAFHIKEDHEGDCLEITAIFFLNGNKTWIMSPFRYRLTGVLDGNVKVDYKVNHSEKEILNSYADNDSLFENLTNDARLHIGDVNYILMFLNTKNIDFETHLPVAGKKNKSNKICKPFYKYKTLKLRLPAKRKKSGQTNNNENEVGNTRLHMCRGHFKTYTKEKPLMGRHVGRYFWQPTIRGNVDNGIIKKDYEVTYEQQ